MNVYIIASYPVSQPSWMNQYSTLTLEDMIKDFALVANCASYSCKDSGMPDRTYYGSAGYHGFSGSWYHNVNHDNDAEWLNFLSKLSDTDKKRTFFNAEAYVFLENGTLLTTVHSCQVAYTNWGCSGGQSKDNKFKMVNIGTGISAHASNYQEEASGGQIEYDGKTYNIAHTIYRKQTPLVLDLKGDGLEFTNVQNGVVFDLNGDGKADKTAWTDVQSEFDDAFLVFDKNNNGKVDNGKELFGNQNGASTGFEELAKYDDNNDGLITKDDASFEKLQLWCDMNKNGVTDNGELKGLTEVGITELSTSVTAKYDENGQLLEDEHGNTIGLVGYFKMLVEEIVDGVKNLVETVRTMIDVLFNTLEL